jgi:hypothetical protein
VVFAAAVAVGVVAPRNAGLAGLALTSALNLTGVCTHMCVWGGAGVSGFLGEGFEYGVVV